MLQSKVLLTGLSLFVAAGALSVGFSFARSSKAARRAHSVQKKPPTCYSLNAKTAPSGNGLSDASIGFIENKGQWDGQAQFLAKSPGLNLWLVQDGMVLDFHRFVPNADQKTQPGIRFARPRGAVQGDVVRMSFVNPRPTEFLGKGEEQGKFNYFRGNDQSRWASNVRMFTEASAHSMYEGIGVRYYFDNGAPRYDLLVEPHADPSQIRLEIDGAQGIHVLENGDLRIQTSLGPVEQRGLLAYQVVGGVKRRVPCQMAVEGNTVRFATASYDKGSSLIIDPLIFSTYLGGSGDGWNGFGDLPASLALDANSNPVVVGLAYSTDFPTTTGAYQTKSSAESAFVTKLAADGSHLIFSTFLNGTQSQQADAVALDISGDPVVTGWTSSTDFPTTAGAFEKTAPSSLTQMGFVTKLASNGASLIYSTYLAGGGSDTPTGICLDSAGNAVVVGNCADGHFPTTTGAFQTVFNGDSADGFVTKLAANGSSLIYSTFLGGVAFSAGDDPQAVAVDSSGNAVVVGFTWSKDFPTTLGAYQRVLKGTYDAFISKVASDGKSLLFSTLLGGSGDNAANAVTFDHSGNIVLAGKTASSDFPVTPGAFQASLKILFGYESAFVSKLSATGSSLLASTYLSGSIQEIANTVSVDPAGNWVLAGESDSADFPTTANAYQQSAGADANAFVSQISSDAKSLVYSSVFGGKSGKQIATAMQLDITGNPVFTGWSSSTDLPTSATAYQKTNREIAGTASGFVSKLDIAVHQKLTFTLNPTTIIGGSASLMTVTLTPAAPAGGAAVALTANGSSFYTLNVAAGSSTGAVNLTTNPVTSTEVILIGASYNGASATANLTIVPPVLRALVVAPTAVTGGASATGTVSLTGPAPTGGKVVSLSSNKAAATVPIQVTVALNASSAAFTIHTTAVTAATAVTITSSMSGVSKTATLTVKLPTLTSLTMVPALVPSGRIGSGVVVLSGTAPAGGYVVLLSGGGSGVTFPVSVVVPAGAATASFKITTPLVDANLSVGVSAKFVTTKTATLTVIPASLYSLGFAPASVVGGASSTGYISLVGSAGPSGVLVTLSGGGSGVGFPATVKVPAGVSLQRFTVTTKHVATKTAVTITGKHGTVSKSAVLTVN